MGVQGLKHNIGKCNSHIERRQGEGTDSYLTTCLLKSGSRTFLSLRVGQREPGVHLWLVSVSQVGCCWWRPRAPRPSPPGLEIYVLGPLRWHWQQRNVTDERRGRNIRGLFSTADCTVRKCVTVLRPDLFCSLDSVTLTITVSHVRGCVHTKEAMSDPWSRIGAPLLSIADVIRRAIYFKMFCEWLFEFPENRTGRCVVLQLVCLYCEIQPVEEQARCSS